MIEPFEILVRDHLRVHVLHELLNIDRRNRDEVRT